MRRLFDGGVTKAKTLAVGGDYSRAETIRGRRLIDEIRYITRNLNRTAQCGAATLNWPGENSGVQ